MRRLALLVLVLVFGMLPVPAASGPVAGSPEPRPFCPSCGQFFEGAADDAGADVTVGRGAALWPLMGSGLLLLGRVRRERSRDDP